MKKSQVMEIVLRISCGIDIHKETAVCCLLRAAGEEVVKEVRTFSTMTGGLKDLRKWLCEAGCQYVVMERAGTGISDTHRGIYK